ncbi:MAG: protein-glutamate O-methyltransferase CheR [Pseudomonadota bacterium]
MKSHEFQVIAQLLRSYSGVELNESASSIVAVKLEPLLDEFAFSSIAQLAAALTEPGNSRLLHRVAEAVAVRESYFFRNKGVFDHLSAVTLPGLMANRMCSRRLRIWCAACSTGQEPYSLAMLLAEKGASLDGWTVEIIATDISKDALARARAGQYSQFEIQRGLPTTKLIKYFERSGASWQIKPEIRSRIVFYEHNLLHDCMEFGVFDIILCRNVFIYLGRELRASILGNLARCLEPDGCLVLGAAETVTGYSNDFVRTPESQAGIFHLRSDRRSRSAQEKMQDRHVRANRLTGEHPLEQRILN